MNEEIQAKLAQYMQYLEDGLKTGADFTAEQAPLVVQEILAWEFIQYVVYGLAFLVPIMILLAGIYKLSKYWNSSDENTAFPAIMFSLIFFIVSAGLFMGVIHNTMGALKVTYAPRLIIIEKATELAGNVMGDR